MVENAPNNRYSNIFETEYCLNSRKEFFTDFEDQYATKASYDTRKDDLFRKTHSTIIGL